MFLSILFKNIFQSIFCVIYLIYFLWILHKRNCLQIRPIVRVYFGAAYVIHYTTGGIITALLAYEAFLKYYDNCIMLSICFFGWSVASLSVIILTEIRRQFMHPVCNVTFSYLLFTTLLCVIRFLDNFYSSSYGIITKVQEFSSINIILLLHFIQLIHASRSHFSIENSVLRNDNPCPEEYVSTLSKILFMWLDSYIFDWYSNGLTSKSTFDLNYECEADINTLNLKRNLYEKMRSHGRDINVWWLFGAIFKVFRVNLIISWCAIVFHILFSFSRPFILKYFLKFINDSQSPVLFGLIISVAFLATGILSSITQNYCLHLTSTTSLKIHSSLVGAIFSKSLSIKNEVKDTFTNAEIVNLMSSDTDKIDSAVAYSWIIISSPFEIILTFAFLLYEVGSAALVGIFILVATFPLNSFAMKWLQCYQIEEMNNKDQRIKSLSEVLNNIKVIKMYSWESYFSNAISKFRDKEVNLIRLGSMCTNFVNIIWDVMPIVVLSSTFWSYNRNNPGTGISAETTFVSLVLFNMIRSPMAVLPYGISVAINGFVSLKRVSSFLTKEESDDHFLSISGDGNEAIKITEGFFSWGRNSKNILNNINISIPSGQLVGLFGKVASGKTSLLNAIIGEMCVSRGRVYLKGSLSYVPQNPWIQKSSAKDNIIFAKRYDELYYKRVVKACALDLDLENITKGDGQSENNCLFSGGQRQRINLARAVYQESDIYLLDDPLSAVDDLVGKNIFNSVISNCGILAGTTRIFATQNMQWLKNFDRIIILHEDGFISYDGDYTNLNGKVLEFMKVNLCRAPISIDLKEFLDDKMGASNSNSYQMYQLNRLHKPLFSQCQTKIRLGSSQRKIEVYDNINSSNSSYFNSTESYDREFNFKVKSVSGSTYLSYFFARGRKLCIFSLVTFGAVTALQVFSNYWIEKMLSHSQGHNNISTMRVNNNEDFTNSNSNVYSNYHICVYTLIGMGQIISAFGFYLSFSLGSANASKFLHDFLLQRVLNAKLQYFHRSSSHILNCFSKDIDNIDNLIPGNLSEVINGIFQVLASLFVILCTFPAFILLIIPMGLLYYMMMSFYMPAACQIQMMCVNSNSPIFTHFNETLQGLPVIRASRQKKHCTMGINRFLNENTKFLYIQNVLNLWLSLRLDILGNLLMFGSVLMAIYYKNVLTPSMVGLTISYSIDIIDLLNWLMIQYVELETNAMALERLNDFKDMESEFENRSNALEKRSNWQNLGKIVFNNVYLRYSKNQTYALKNISMTIEPGEIIGVVGRTGSGKTSLAQSLFRFKELTSGEIYIDGVNIQDIPLDTLRRSLTMFPQDSTVFSGTILQNLDPHNEFDLETLKSALDLSDLGKWVESIDKNLNYDCGENGSNLSVGQRQLLCLARVILRNSKIIIFDEATASIDQGTDQLIMTAIRRRFASSTIIIIAHRMDSLKDVDKIAVIDNGSLIEFGPPQELMNSSEGYFSRFKDPL